MKTFNDLFDLMRDFVKYQAEKEGSVCYLYYDPVKSQWGYYDVTVPENVWNFAMAPHLIQVLVLEVDQAKQTLAVDTPTEFKQNLLRYAVFTASRPAMVGLHHFIVVEEPPALKQERLDQTDGQ